MKLFSKKKEETQPELPPLKFPEFPAEDEEASPPKYESTMSPKEETNIKEAVAPMPSSQPAEDLDIPIRKPSVKGPMPNLEATAATPEPIKAAPQPTRIEEPPAMEESIPKAHATADIQTRGKTLFVKVEKYKEAMQKMDHAKEKLKDAEEILKKLDELKKEEDEELRLWNQDIEALKAKLMEVDKTLFE